MINFSIIVPTRNRIDWINRLLESISSTSDEPENIEVVFRIDSDDDLSSIRIKELDTPMKIGLASGQRGNLSEMWEDGYKISNGRWIMMCADDVIFRTKSWDSVIDKSFQDPNNVPYFVWGNDLHFGQRLATLPIVSRCWVEQCGYFSPSGYNRGWCDAHLHDVAGKLTSLGCGHVVFYFDNIIFEHMHPEAGKAQIDDTYYYRLRMPSCYNQFHVRDNERWNDARRMAAYIENNEPNTSKISS